MCVVANRRRLHRCHCHRRRRLLRSHSFATASLTPACYSSLLLRNTTSRNGIWALGQRRSLTDRASRVPEAASCCAAAPVIQTTILTCHLAVGDPSPHPHTDELSTNGAELSWSVLITVSAHHFLALQLRISGSRIQANTQPRAKLHIGLGMLACPFSLRAWSRLFPCAQ